MTKYSEKTRLLAMAVVLALMMTIPVAGTASVPGDPCQGPQGIGGMGSRAQLPVQLNLFIPSYYQTCPAASGSVSYQAASDSAAATAIQQHSQGSDPDNFPWVSYSSDLPLSIDEYSYSFVDVSHVISKPAPDSNINHLPVMLNGFAIGYNLSGCSTSPVQLTSQDLATIYSGSITRWSQLVDNPQLATCPLSIRVSARLDEAASSVVLKDFMSTSLPTFDIYKQKKLNTVWPTTVTIGCLGTGEAGMGSCLLTPGTIGYLEYREAKSRNIPTAKVVNSSNVAFSPASSSSLGWPDNCELAASAATPPFSTSDPSWITYTLTTARDGYPLCAYSYQLVFTDLSRSYGNAMTSGRARNLADYLHSELTDQVQASLPQYGYAYVPVSVRDTVRAGIDGLNL
ncbi:MAG: substrate-binding domain-containing protein [Actinomycetota bacterium]|nr:substrate-binding domain-containing protein [Actinomycetota bacterium]